MRNKLLGDRYRILDLIGEGGMAYVYLATDEKLGRRVAVKVLHEHMERNPEIRQRFQAEAQTISALDHPNIVKIYDFSGDHDGRLWIVTEVIQGKNIAQYLQDLNERWLHPVIAACIIAEVCKGLAVAHDHGIVHRDIKPENIMMTFEGRVILMDFGIAKDLGKSNITVTGTFMGSPSYMSPEQVRGRDVDWRSDIYSLSILFYELVTGRLPFLGQNTHDVVLKIMEGNFTHPRFLVPTLPLVLNDLIVRGMAKHVGSRPQSAEEYRSILDGTLGDMGFNESHIELERCAKDPDTFRSRLRGADTVMVHAPKTPTVAQMPPPRPEPIVPIEPKPAAAMAAPPKPSQRAPAPAQRQEAPPRSRLAVAPIPTAMPQQLAAAPRPRPQRPVADPALRMHQRRVAASIPAQRTWFSYSLSVTLMAATAILSVWGIMLIQPRLGEESTTFSSESDGWSQGKRASARATRQGTRQRVDGTPTRAVVTKGTPPSAASGTSAATTPNDKPREKSPPEPSVRFTGKKRRNARNPELKSPNLVRNDVVRAVPVPIPIDSGTPRRLDSVDGKKMQKTTTNTDGNQLPEVGALSATERSERSDRGDTIENRERQAAPDKLDTRFIAMRTRARVIVSSQPAAEIFIDGKRVGTTIDRTADSGPISVASGHHTLELRRAGYTTYRRAIDLSAEEVLTLPRVALGGMEPNANQPVVLLTVRSNLEPAQFTLRNLSTNATQISLVRAGMRPISLIPGRYYLRIERGTEFKERELVINGNEGQLTFNADFRN
ncbi:MAG: PEGA domain-containing protein [Deltaproteobacteria bacterium]|nr:PEGA domain-containing protein [Deltaproteobacteria bacterium]